MRRQKQLIQHDPDNGLYGDCYRTAIACILDLPAEDVPHFLKRDSTAESQDDVAADWLQKHWKLTPVVISYLPNDDNDSVLEYLGKWSQRGSPFIITGQGSRGFNHCVVGYNGEIYCDPYTGDRGDRTSLELPSMCEDGKRYWVVEYLCFYPSES